MGQARLRLLWQRILAFLDDIMPMFPDDRAMRDDDGRDHSARLQQEMRLRALGKRGKGGYR